MNPKILKIVEIVFVVGGCFAMAMLINKSCNPAPKEKEIVIEEHYTPYRVDSIVHDTIRPKARIIYLQAEPPDTNDVACVDTTINRGGIAPDTLGVCYDLRTNKFEIDDRPAPRLKETVFETREHEIEKTITEERKEGFFEKIGSSVKSVITHFLAFLGGYVAGKITP